MLSDIIDRLKLPFQKDRELRSEIYAMTGVYPHAISYYELALMHRSLLHKEKGRPVNNERLEFLGDAILDAVAGDIVYRHFPGKREGFLTNTRSKLVQRETLNRLAQEIGLVKKIQSNGRGASHNSYMGGNALEALVGAIYLDRGYAACMKFMNERVLGKMINIDKVAYKEVNFKSKLIEWSQKNKVRLDFELIDQHKDKTGSPVFGCKVVIEGIEGSTGTGYSKKESQQTAAKIALTRLRREPQFIDKVFEAKTQRTRMEEEPVQTVPDVEEQDDFIVHNTAADAPQERGDGAVVGSKKQGRSTRNKRQEEPDDGTTEPETQAETAATSAVERQQQSKGERKSRRGGRRPPMYEAQTTADADDDREAKMREDIIARAEEAAFAEERQADNNQ